MSIKDPKFAVPGPPADTTTAWHPTGVEGRLADLEARVRKLETRVGSIDSGALAEAMREWDRREDSR